MRYYYLFLVAVNLGFAWFNYQNQVHKAGYAAMFAAGLILGWAFI